MKYRIHWKALSRDDAELICDAHLIGRFSGLRYSDDRRVLETLQVPSIWHVICGLNAGIIEALNSTLLTKLELL